VNGTALLPSGRSARALWTEGLREAAPGIAWNIAQRAAMIYAGLVMVGQRRNLVRSSVAGAAAVEVAVLLYVRRAIR